ncbi:MAG: hypothetical protein M3Y22_01335 [Pseudomonadota bacterium]|nr:hypothetical protein [Pseudomonadota bacterium]
MMDSPELDGATERFLIDRAGADCSAANLKLEVIRLVRSHAERLGMDGFGAAALVRAIEAL